MASLFAYTDEWRISVSTVLAPSPTFGIRDDARQVRMLEDLGFTCVWDVQLAQRMERLGAVLAKTRTQEGVNWMFARAAWADGLARWARRADVALINVVLKTVNDRDNPEDITAAIGKLAQLSEEEREALEAVIRLGTPDAVLRYLEHGGPTW